MARFRNVRTGVVVSVAEGKRLDAEWEPVVAPTPAPQVKRRRPRKVAND